MRAVARVDDHIESDTTDRGVRAEAMDADVEDVDPLGGEDAGELVQQGLASAGRYLAFRTWLDDRPGMLHELTGILTAERINILHIGIHRLGPYAAIGRVGLDVIVDTRDRAHADSVLALIRGKGFPAEELLDTSAP